MSKRQGGQPELVKQGFPQTVACPTLDTKSQIQSLGGGIEAPCKKPCVQRREETGGDEVQIRFSVTMLSRSHMKWGTYSRDRARGDLVRDMRGTFFFGDRTEERVFDQDAVARPCGDSQGHRKRAWHVVYIRRGYA